MQCPTLKHCDKILGYEVRRQDQASYVTQLIELIHKMSRQTWKINSLMQND